MDFRNNLSQFFNFVMGVRTFRGSDRNVIFQGKLKEI